MIQLLFLGAPESIGAIHTQVQKRPFAVEKERVNFEMSRARPLEHATIPARSAHVEMVG